MTETCGTPIWMTQDLDITLLIEVLLVIHNDKVALLSCYFLDENCRIKG